MLSFGPKTQTKNTKNNVPEAYFCLSYLRILSLRRPATCSVFAFLKVGRVIVARIKESVQFNPPPDVPRISCPLLLKQICALLYEGAHTSTGSASIDDAVAGGLSDGDG